MVESTPKIKVLIADVMPMFRQGIRSVLDQQPDIEVCGEAGTSQDLLSKVSTLTPDVILLDISLSPDSGFELARAVLS